MAEKKTLPQENREEKLQVANLQHSDVESVQAELVRLHQSSARSIGAEKVELHQSAAGRLQVESVEAHESAVGAVRAAEVALHNSAVGAVQAESVRVAGSAVAVVGRSVSLGNTYAGFVAGGNIRGERIETLVLLGRRVEGDVQAVLDTRTALLAGVVGGLLAGLVLLLGRLLSSSES